MRRLALGIALLGLVFPAISHALGLGSIDVKSALNEPLQAEIALISATEDDVEDIQVRLAPKEIFDRVGIARPFYLTDLKFKPVMTGRGQAVVMVSTKNPVKEPFLNFLIEISWPKGRLLREYTVLLDPPVMMDQQRSVSTQAPAATPAPPSQPSPPRQASTRPAPSQDSAPPAAVDLFTPGQNAGLEQVTVRKGDTLSQVVQQMRPDSSVSTNQMMIALLRANPEAFFDANINNLKSGYILRAPSREQIQSVSKGEALAEVRQQNALWREYRSRLAGGASSRSALAGNADLTDTGRDGSSDRRGASAQNVAASERNLELLGADSGSGGGTRLAGGEDVERLQNDLSLAREALESRTGENEELRARVRELEENLSKKDRLLELQNNELTDLNTRLERQGLSGEGSDTDLPGESPTDVDEPAIPEEPVEAPQEPDVNDESSMRGGIDDEPVTDGDSLDVEPIPDEEPAIADLGEADQGGDEAAMEGPGVTAGADVQTEPVPEPDLTPPAVQSEDGLLSNPTMLMAAGFGGLLVLALAWLVVRRLGKKEEEMMPSLGGETPSSFGDAFDVADASPDLVGFDEPEADVESAASAPVEEAIPDFDIESPEPDLAVPAAGDLEADEAEAIESDDATAEADVYLAYALYQQAEDLLKGALQDNPDKSVYRLKLLETYFANKDKDAFDAMAQELHGALGGKDSVLWNRAVAMGKEISPDNPLFSGVSAGVVSVDDFVPKKPQATDFDLGDDFGSDDVGGLSDLDMGEDDLDDGLNFAGADSTVTMELPTGLDLEDELQSTQTFEAGDLEMPEISDFDTDAGEPTLGAGADDTSEIEFDLGELDLGDLDLDGTQEPTDTLAALASADEELGLDTSVTGTASKDDALDLDMGELDMGELDMGDLDMGELDMGELDMGDLDMGELDMGELDMEGLELDGLDSGLTEQAPALDTAASLSESMSELTGEATTELAPDDDELISGGDEVSTKLDLAKAYIDMGDDEGARSTLEEVISEGSAKQKSEAQELMGQIA